MRRSWVGAAAIVLVSAWFAATTLQAATSYADARFKSQWEQGEALAPNFWGPLANAKDGRQEPYKESPGGQRLVQYFDKGRMELTNGVVTNGLLASDLVKGQIQIGDAAFQSKASPAIPIAGDSDNPGPTYAQLSTKGMALLQDAPKQLGTYTLPVVSQSGDITPGSGAPPAYAAYAQYEFATHHNVSRAFFDYREKAGLETIGIAIAEPFFTTVKVAGQQRLVLVQVFERRVLTYTESNPDAFKVEMGNIGQHYFQWRYPSQTARQGTATTPNPAGFVVPVPAVPARGDGYICRDFPSQAKAQAYLRAYPDDPSGLDPDRSGIACKNSPGPFDTNPVKRT